MDELRWYLYDLVRGIMEKHGIEETAYSLETVREGAVCLIPSDYGFLVSGGGDEDSEQEDFYRGCRELFLRVFRDDETAETAMQEFLTRTLDLPVIMKGPSVSGLEARIRKCQEEMEALEKKALESDGQKWKAKLNLDRIYLGGLLKNLNDTDKKRYEKIKTEII